MAKTTNNTSHNVFPAFNISPDAWAELEQAAGVSFDENCRTGLKAYISVLCLGISEVPFDTLCLEVSELEFDKPRKLDLAADTRRSLERLNRAATEFHQALRELPIDAKILLEREYANTIKSPDGAHSSNVNLMRLLLRVAQMDVTTTFVLKLAELSRSSRNVRQRSKPAKFFLRAINNLLRELGIKQGKVPRVGPFLQSLWPYLPAEAHHQLASVKAALKTLQRLRKSVRQTGA